MKQRNNYKVIINDNNINLLINLEELVYQS